MAETVLTSKIDNMVPEEVQKKLANLYNKYQQLSPEDKKKFQKNAIEMLTEAVEKPSNTVAPTGFMLYKPYIPFVFAASCVTFLLVMGVRRLRRHMRHREERQTEKKKRKQEKAEEKRSKKTKKVE